MTASARRAQLRVAVVAVGVLAVIGGVYAAWSSHASFQVQCRQSLECSIEGLCVAEQQSNGSTNCSATHFAKLWNEAPSCNVRVARIDPKRRLAVPGANPSQSDVESGFFAVSGSVPPPRTKQGDALQLELSGPVQRSTVQALDLRPAFENRSKKPLTVVRPVDGTLEHVRDPSYDLYLRNEASGRIYRWASVGGRCGNVDPLQKADFVTIASGARWSKVPDKAWSSYLEDARIRRPGRYTLWVVYRFCSFHPPPDGVGLGPDFVDRSALRGVVASNALRVVVH